MDERHRTLRAAPRLCIDELDTAGGEAIKRASDIVDLEADVVETLASRLQVSSDARGRVGRLDKLDLRLTYREESDRYAVRLDGQDQLHWQAQSVAIQGERLVDVANDDRHMVDTSGRREG